MRLDCLTSLSWRQNISEISNEYQEKGNRRENERQHQCCAKKDEIREK